MKVLIVECNPNLAAVWAEHLKHMGFGIDICHDQETASDKLLETKYNVIVLNLTLKNGAALALADYASYRWPHAQVIFVTSTCFFSDGSIFRHSPNACAFLPKGTLPSDLANMVDFYGQRGNLS